MKKSMIWTLMLALLRNSTPCAILLCSAFLWWVRLCGMVIFKIIYFLYMIFFLPTSSLFLPSEYFGLFDSLMFSLHIATCDGFFSLLSLPVLARIMWIDSFLMECPVKSDRTAKLLTIKSC